MDDNSVLEALETVTPQEQALAIVRAYCGWHVTPIIQEEIFVDMPRPSSIVFLQSLRVVGVHSVEYRAGCDWRSVPLCDISHSGLSWSQNGMIEWGGRNTCGTFPTGIKAVQVNYTHGFDIDEVKDFLSVVAGVAGRIEAGGNIKKQAVNGASVEFFGNGDDGARAGLLESEKRILDRYRLKAEIL